MASFTCVTLATWLRHLHCHFALDCLGIKKVLNSLLEPSGRIDRAPCIPRPDEKINTINYLKLISEKGSILPSIQPIVRRTLFWSFVYKLYRNELGWRWDVHSLFDVLHFSQKIVSTAFKGFKANWAPDNWAPDSWAPGPNLPLFGGGQLGPGQLGPRAQLYGA